MNDTKQHTYNDNTLGVCSIRWSCVRYRAHAIHRFGVCYFVFSDGFHYSLMRFFLLALVLWYAFAWLCFTVFLPIATRFSCWLVYFFVFLFYSYIHFWKLYRDLLCTCVRVRVCMCVNASNNQSTQKKSLNKLLCFFLLLLSSLLLFAIRFFVVPLLQIIPYINVALAQSYF